MSLVVFVPRIVKLGAVIPSWQTAPSAMLLTVPVTALIVTPDASPGAESPGA